MPARLKIRVMGGRNLPVMDKSSDTSDAFVEVKIGNFSGKTEVCRHSLNPVWNSEWFKFEVPDEELQDEPLQIRIMDYDTYSANDAIGKVYINLSPLLYKECGHTMWGFYPIYDTMHGTRGEIYCVIKMEPFSDSNKFRQTSCGIRFFHSPIVPFGFYCVAILGFVEELVVNDDPEYQWIDKIRTPRASNEARQTLFYKLSGEVQRKIGIKALELGGNAVLGFQLYFDLEGESGVVVRGIGTSVILKKINKQVADASGNVSYGRQFQNSMTINVNEASFNSPSSPPILQSTNSSNNLNEIDANFSSVVDKIKGECSSPIKATSVASHRKNFFESDTSPNSKQINVLSNLYGNIDYEDLNTTNTPKYKFMILGEGLSFLEYPFITMKQFPIGFIQFIGGVVSSRSVKHLAQLNSPEDPETRDAWWMELRKEVRSHCKLLGCDAVLGYTETSCICDDVVILSVSGTAAVLNMKSFDFEEESCSPNNNKTQTFSLNNNLNQSKTSEYSDTKNIETSPINNNILKTQQSDSIQSNNSTMNRNRLTCSLCHVPYGVKKAVFKASLTKCAMCKIDSVPDVIFMTIEPPYNIPSVGIGCLIQARVFRNKKDTRGEQCAKELSDSLPFLEYEMHKQLLSKLKMKGMNAIFGLSVQISVGENMLLAIATGTGAYLLPLPEPSSPQVSSGKSVRITRLNDIQKIILDSVERNKERYDLVNINSYLSSICDKTGKNQLFKDESKSNENSDEEVLSPRTSTTKPSPHCVVLEVDDSDDADIISLMIDSEVPKNYEMCNIDQLPGNEHFLCIYQTFTKVFRAKITSTKQFSTQFDWMIQSLFVKLRRYIPCVIAGLRFKIDAPETDTIQISIVGSVAALRKLNEFFVCKNGVSLYLPTHCYQDKKSRQFLDKETAFDGVDENLCDKLELPAAISSVYDLPNRGNPACVELTPLSYIPKCTIVKYIGNLTFPFIRETTSMRECGGLNGFLTSFLNEVLLIVRTHIVGLNGNALVSMNITQLVLLHNPHKNQAQCLIIISGDVVKANYSNFFKSDDTQESYLD